MGKVTIPQSPSVTAPFTQGGLWLRVGADMESAPTINNRLSVTARLHGASGTPPPTRDFYVSSQPIRWHGASCDGGIVILRGKLMYGGGHNPPPASRAPFTQGGLWLYAHRKKAPLEGSWPRKRTEGWLAATILRHPATPHRLAAELPSEGSRPLQPANATPPGRADASIGPYKWTEIRNKKQRLRTVRL